MLTPMLSLSKDGRVPTVGAQEVKMTKFTQWCTETESGISTHKLHQLTASEVKIPDAVTLVASAVPEYYAAPSRISELLMRLGKPAAAAYVAGKLPTKKTIKSGDLGEILCNAYIFESTRFTLGIRRLRWKDHRDMSMRGEDVLAFNIDPKGVLSILKAEVKSRASMTTAVIEEARAALSYNNELPSPHAVSFVADRLDEAADAALRDALDKAQLLDGIRISQVSHMLFTFSGSNPSKLLTTNLTSYSGGVQQYYVTLRVEKHQDFIKSVFEAVIK